MSFMAAVAQLELSTRFRARRNELGLTSGEVASHLDVTRNYVSIFENNRTTLARDRLDVLLDLYRFDETEADELRRLHDESRARGWWTQFADLLGDGELVRFFGLESGAKSIRNYEPQLVPGLLQTRDYAEAVIGADARTSEATVRRRWQLRETRQQRLSGEDPLTLTVLLSEAVLQQHFGDATVLRDQLKHLAALAAESDSVAIRVLPFDSSPLGLTGSSTLMLLEFASPHLPTMAWREAITPIGLTDDPDEVETLRVSFEQALDQSSLNREASLALIEERIGALS